MNKIKPQIRIGSRGSRLALLQAGEVKKLLLENLDWEEDRIEIFTIKTLGDKITDRPFRELEGKGVFCREIEKEIITGNIDIGVHSLKDMPFEQPEGLAMAGFLKRENPLDVLISRKGETIESLPAGLRIGTSSIRRQKQILSANPEVAVVEIRGNIDSRIGKWETGDVEGIVLAAAGLNRMGIWDIPRYEIPVETCLPAPAQGVICLETHKDEEWLNSLIEGISHNPTRIQATTERYFLNTLEGSCELPVGALAEIKGPNITLTGEFFSEKKGQLLRGMKTGPIVSHLDLGRELAESLLSRE